MSSEDITDQIIDANERAAALNREPDEGRGREKKIPPSNPKQKKKN